MMTTTRKDYNCFTTIVYLYYIFCILLHTVPITTINGLVVPITYTRTVTQQQKLQIYSNCQNNYNNNNKNRLSFVSSSSVSSRAVEKLSQLWMSAVNIEPLDQPKHKHQQPLVVQEDDKYDSVATQFGQPIGDDTKEWNTRIVHTIKNIIFDTFYKDDKKTIQLSLDRAYARFYTLETIARMPYFSYVSVLHLYETLGLLHHHDIIKVHFCQNYNELHHLLIMEELGGNNKWFDRFIAQHIAFAYYWIVVTIYLYNPVIAYNLNQCVEEEAYETYNKFCIEYATILQQQPPSKIAVQYYTNPDNQYMHNNMKHNTISSNDNKDAAATSRTTTTTTTTSTSPEQQTQETQTQHKKITSMYDVFIAIRDDELDHAQTMKYYQQ